MNLGGVCLTPSLREYFTAGARLCFEAARSKLTALPLNKDKKMIPRKPPGAWFTNSKTLIDNVSAPICPLTVPS